MLEPLAFKDTDVKDTNSTGMKSFKSLMGNDLVNLCGASLGGDFKKATLKGAERALYFTNNVKVFAFAILSSKPTDFHNGAKVMYIDLVCSDLQGQPMAGFDTFSVDVPDPRPGKYLLSLIHAVAEEEGYTHTALRAANSNLVPYYKSIGYTLLPLDMAGRCMEKYNDTELAIFDKQRAIFDKHELGEGVFYERHLAGVAKELLERELSKTKTQRKSPKRPMTPQSLARQFFGAFLSTPVGDRGNMSPDASQQQQQQTKKRKAYDLMSSHLPRPRNPF